MDKFKCQLSAGEVLFRQGEIGNCAYVIESGGIEIFQDVGGACRVVARLGAADIFGEMTLFGEKTRSASARATEATILVVVTHDYLGVRLQSADPMLRHLLRTLTTRLRRLLNAGGDSTSPLIDDIDRAAALERVRREQELTLALDLNQFQMHYQPINHLKNGSVAGYEALIRWQHPQKGMVPPMQFIPLAEESNLIVRMGHWIIDTSCAALAQLEKACSKDAPMFMSINLSERQLHDPELLDVIDRSLQKWSVAAAQIKLEITETLLLESFEEAVPVLHACRARGLRISLDDFGTGYSSLSYLHRLPVGTLKLDRSFVQQLDINAAGRKILGALIQLAHSLEMDVIAEGIESAEQAAALRELGSDMAQGYHFARPAPLAKLIEQQKAEAADAPVDSRLVHGSSG